VSQDYASAATLVLGVFGGSTLWWLALSGVAGLLREGLDAPAVRWVSRISGVVLAGLGLSALVSLL